MQQDSAAISKAHARYMMARAWHSKGMLPAAMAAYREALALEPCHLEASVLLGGLLQSQVRLDEAADIYRRALEHHPNDARLHKHFVTVLLAQEGPDAVFRYYRLTREDSRTLCPRPPALLCCFVLRNELPRLPYFLEYYREKGVETFLAVDNASSDGSVEYLLDQPDVYVWRSDWSFNRANFGAGWFEPILRAYGQGHWCLIVDPDELLYYRDCEHRTIADLCRQLDRQGKRALKAIHLDMYSDVSIEETHYAPGQSFEEVCPYFDRRFYHTCEQDGGPFQNQEVYWGGARQRVFGEGQYYLSKVPLLKYDEECILAGGQHWTNLPVSQIALERGCLLHFKFFSSFCERVPEEARRKEHSGQASQYQAYEQGLRDRPSLSFYDPAHSVKLENSQQLVDLGIIQPGNSVSDAPQFPKIEPVPPGERPFWSVMLTVYRRTEFLEQALRSVLAQAPGPGDMQIEVVSDGSPEEIHSSIEGMVRSIAGDRVHFYRSPVRAGQPEIINVCVRRARGLWIHILHDDDWVAPGFYAALQAGILRAPDAGAAFCRHTYTDVEGRTLSSSPVERETPGIIEDWLDRIACLCRLQTPSIVVRREAYERVGGYCPQAKSVFDWEMWQRLAVHYPVWFEPTPLAFFRQSGQSEGARLKATGEQIADTRAVIEIARTYLPAGKVDNLSRRASENYALFAFEHARKQMDAGNLAGVIANLREGIRCSHSADVINKLFSWLARTEQAKP